MVAKISDGPTKCSALDGGISDRPTRLEEPKRGETEQPTTAKLYRSEGKEQPRTFPKPDALDACSGGKANIAGGIATNALDAGLRPTDAATNLHGAAVSGGIQLQLKPGEES